MIYRDRILLCIMVILCICPGNVLAGALEDGTCCYRMFSSLYNPEKAAFEHYAGTIFAAYSDDEGTYFATAKHNVSLGTNVCLSTPYGETKYLYITSPTDYEKSKFYINHNGNTVEIFVHVLHPTHDLALLYTPELKNIAYIERYTNPDKFMFVELHGYENCEYRYTEGCIFRIEPEYYYVKSSLDCGSSGGPVFTRHQVCIGMIIRKNILSDYNTILNGDIILELLGNAVFFPTNLYNDNN